MLGWLIYICKKDTSPTDGTTDRARARILQWEASPGGLDWIDALVNQGKAVLLETNGGYPVKYLTTFRSIAPLIDSGPPKHRGPELFDEDYFLPSGWTGKSKIDRDEIDHCSVDDEMLVTAWDLS